MQKLKKIIPDRLYLLFVLLGFAYGGCLIAGKAAVSSCSPLQTTTLRLGISLVVLTILYRVLLRKPLTLPAMLLFKVWGAGLLLQATTFALFFMGLQNTSAGLGGIIESTVPLLVFVLSWVMAKHRESCSPQVLLSLIIGMAGILLVFAPKVHLEGSQSELTGCIFILLSSTTFALGTICNRKLLQMRKAPTLEACVYQQNLISFIAIALLTVMVEGVPAVESLQFSFGGLCGILYLGIVASAVANHLYSLFTKRWGAVRAGAVSYLIPVAAILLDFGFYGNLPTPTEALGVAIILIGIVMLQRGKRPIQQGHKLSFCRRTPYLGTYQRQPA